MDDFKFINYIDSLYYNYNTNSIFYDGKYYTFNYNDSTYLNNHPTSIENMLSNINHYKDNFSIELYHNNSEVWDKTVIVIKEIKNDRITYIRKDYGIKFKLGLEERECNSSIGFFKDYTKQGVIIRGLPSSNVLQPLYFFGSPYAYNALQKFYKDQISHLKGAWGGSQLDNKMWIYVVYNNTVHSVHDNETNRQYIERNFPLLTFKVASWGLKIQEDKQLLMHYIYKIIRTTPNYSIIFNDHVKRYINARRLQNIYINRINNVQDLFSELINDITFGQRPNLDRSFFSRFLHNLDRKCYLTGQKFCTNELIIALTCPLEDITYDINLN